MPVTEGREYLPAVAPVVVITFNAALCDLPRRPPKEDNEDPNLDLNRPKNSSWGLCSRTGAAGPGRRSPVGAHGLRRVSVRLLDPSWDLTGARRSLSLPLSSVAY